MKLNHENPLCTGKPSEPFLNVLRKNQKVEHITLVCSVCTDPENRNKQVEFLLHLKQILVSVLKSVRTLYLDADAWTIGFFWVEDFLLHPSLEKVTLVNRIDEADSTYEVDFHSKHINGTKTIDFYGYNMHFGLWLPIISGRSSTFKHLEELKVHSHPQCPMTLGNISPTAPCSNLKSLSITGITISDMYFHEICLNCTQLKRLEVNCENIVSLSRFSDVINLKNLNFFVVKMSYGFSREELTKVFEDSEFPRLFVEVIEFGGIDEPESVVLKDGLIKIQFSVEI